MRISPFSETDSVPAETEYIDFAIINTLEPDQLKSWGLTLIRGWENTYYIPAWTHLI